MFQNISKGTKENYEENVQYEGESKLKDILKKNLTVQNCIMYALTLMLSLVGGKDSAIFTSIAPFGFAMVAASVGARIPVAIVTLITLIGTTIKFGGNGLLFYILTLLIFLAFILIKRPIEDEDRNEQIKVGAPIAIAVLLVQVAKMVFKGFLLYDLAYSLMLAITTFIPYKIFVNAITVFRDYKIKTAFSIEEVMGAGLMLAIAVNCLGSVSIFGFNLRNILSILIVLVMGWKNGMLVGGTTGITIGTVIGILNGQDVTMLAAYAISGLIAGILNKLGKAGVIVGFIMGNIVLSYVANGNTIEVIKFQEILIAALGLLAVPKTYKIKISDIISDEKLLPETTTRTLEENKETINKLASMSDTISQMAKQYENAAATIVTDEELEEQQKLGREVFEEELANNLEGKEDNLLYNDIIENTEGILDEIFEQLIQREVITSKDIVKIFANHNNYIMGFDPEEKEDIVAKSNIDDMVRAINSAYRVSKLNFIWKKKLDENKKTMSSQLNGVSEALSNLASQIDTEEQDPYALEKEEIKTLIKDKEISVKDISIKQEESGRYNINLYTNVCNSVDGTSCNIKQIAKVLQKVLKEKMVLQKQKCGLRANDDTCMFKLVSEDNFTMQVGIAKSKKADSIISGDTTTQTKLEDGKYLLAISDGMGSGPEARKSSKIAIKMLERLLTSGFNKDTALKLINTTISANTEDDMYATLDVNILDLYKGEMDFIKNGACPTFIKRNGKVEVLKSIALPTGILDNIDLIEYNYKLEDGDIIVMCSDGILDSNKEYASKELWVQEVLEDVETDDSQRIADILLSESKDNDFGKEKDDMTVIVCKINKKSGKRN